MTEEKLIENILRSETEIAVFQLLRQEIKLGGLITPLRISSESVTRAWIIGKFKNPKFRTTFKLDEKSKGLLLATLVGNAKLVDTLPKRMDVVLKVIDDYDDYYNREPYAIDDVILYLYDTESSDFAKVELYRNDIKFNLDEYFGYFDVDSRVDPEEWGEIRKRIENHDPKSKVVKEYKPITDKPFEMTIGYSKDHMRDVRGK